MRRRRSPAFRKSQSEPTHLSRMIDSLTSCNKSSKYPVHCPMMTTRTLQACKRRDASAVLDLDLNSVMSRLHKMPVTKDRAMINSLPEVPQKPMCNRNHILTDIPSQTLLSETRRGPLRITIGTSVLEWKTSPQERRYGLPTLQQQRSFLRNNIPIRGVTCRSNSVFETLTSELRQIRTIISSRPRRHIYHLSQVVYYGTERPLLQCPCPSTRRKARTTALIPE
jgi:hypothetical protein